jgi:hypothetical protein
MPQETGLSPQKHLTNLWIVKPGEATNRGSGIKVWCKVSLSLFFFIKEILSVYCYMKKFF